MSEYLQLRYLATLGALGVLGASAQPTSLQPPTPAASVTTTQSNTTPYRSAFENYQPFAEEKVLPWKDANDAVRAIGGWRAYANEAKEESGKPRTAPAGSVGPAPGQAKP